MEAGRVPSWEAPLSLLRQTPISVRGTNQNYYTDLILVNHNLIPILRDVQWGDVNDTTRFPGAGDLYWDPLIRTGPVLSTQPELAVQRDRFMSCAAKSMLDVYLAGPRVHGEAGASPPELALVQVESDACWEHFAANDAMLAALNAFDSRYFNAVLSLGGFLQFANSLFVGLLGPMVDLTPGAATNTFLKRVEARLGRDLRTIRQAYADNAREYPKGFQSAHQNGHDDLASADKMALLGVLPRTSSASSGPPIPHVDRPPSSSATGSSTVRFPACSGAVT